MIELRGVSISGLSFDVIICYLKMLDRPNLSAQVTDDYNPVNFNERVINTIISLIR
jgi:hypothetical protein